jgi:beta-galactosidase
MYETQKWSKPATMQLTTSKVADNEYQLEVLLRDKNGVPCLDSTAFVRFSITGDARLVADQGTSSSASKVQVYNGRAHIKAVLDGDRACVGVSSNGLETQLKFIGAPSG